MSAQQLEELAIEVYAACFDRYDRHRAPFADPRTGALACRDIRGAWSWLHEEQREMCRDQARRAAAWLKAHPEASR